MDGAEWLNSTDPRPMLKSLRGKPSGRKLLLFLCACCRRVWDALSDVRSRAAVETAEQYADERATEGALQAAYHDAERAANVAYFASRLRDVLYPAAQAAWHAVASGSPLLRRAHVVSEVVRAAAAAYAAAGSQDVLAIESVAERAANAEERMQASLLRDLFNNPFRLITFDLASRSPNVLSLARTAYEERIMPEGLLDPSRLAVLSDALEEAGCDNDDLLSHLRGPGPHVRGCWVVDLLLGKE